MNVLETEGGEKRGKVFSGFITNRNKLSVHDKICPLIQCELAGKNHSVMCWPALEVAEKWKRKKMTEDHLHSSCSPVTVEGASVRVFAQHEGTSVDCCSVS